MMIALIRAAEERRESGEGLDDRYPGLHFDGDWFGFGNWTIVDPESVAYKASFLVKPGECPNEKREDKEREYREARR